LNLLGATWLSSRVH